MSEISKTSTEYYECTRCGISNLHKTRMCPCPRGGCEAEVKGRLETVVSIIREPQNK